MKKTKKDLEKEIMEMSKKFERLNKEYSMKKAEIRDLKAEVKKLNEDIVIAFEEEEVEVIGQMALVGAFKTKLKEIVKTYHNTTIKEATPRQKEMIRNGIRDKVGMELNAEQIKFINKLNVNQASHVIRLLSGISWYNQRQALSEVVAKFEDRDNYGEILKQVKSNIYKAEYFELNKDLIRAISEMESPTEAQVRRIANLAIYPETNLTLENQYGIVVDEYEVRNSTGYYTFNWDALKADISKKMTKSDCYNFIQTWDYISNYYATQELDNQEIKELKSLYIRLGEYENTRLTYLKTIQKKDYNRIVSDLEKRIRANQVANNLDKDILREMYKLNDVDRNLNMLNNKEQNIELSDEEKVTRDIVKFVYNIYGIIGMQVPEEMAGLLPYFNGKDKSAGIEEHKLVEFRNVVFKQREVIKEVDPTFNWAYFICSQSNEVLKILGLDAML